MSNTKERQEYINAWKRENREKVTESDRKYKRNRHLIEDAMGEKQREQNRQWQKANPAKMKEYALRAKAKRQAEVAKFKAESKYFTKK